MPFDLWRNAVIRLAKQKGEKSLNLLEINTEWPFLTYIKRMFFDFILDALILLIPAWILGSWIYNIVDLSNRMTFELFVMCFLSYVVAQYILLPMILTFVRDVVLVYVILPFRKLISWLRKPAQYVDINHSGEIKKD